MGELMEKEIESLKIELERVCQQLGIANLILKQIAENCTEWNPAIDYVERCLND